MENMSSPLELSYLQLIRNLRAMCAYLLLINGTSFPNNGPNVVETSRSPLYVSDKEEESGSGFFFKETMSSRNTSVASLPQAIEFSLTHFTVSPLLQTNSAFQIMPTTISPTRVLATMSDSLSHSSSFQNSLLSESSSSDITDQPSFMCSDFHAWEQQYNSSPETRLRHLQEIMENFLEAKQEFPAKYTIIVILYSLIVVVSCIGNLFVVWAIFSRKRTRTTVNIFIGNLACSDLMMTIFNIPFTVARLLMTEWIFGDFLCHIVPFIQATSVYVSTLTMAFIAVDRFQAILRPMKRRISSKVGTCVAIIVIWIASCLFSLPFLFFNRVVLNTNYPRPTLRCEVTYPEPHQEVYQKGTNVITFILQFFIPLSIMVILYTKIGIKIWSRVTIGATTREQETRQLSAKRRTIVMLLLVAIVFALCWMPLNVYHLYVDFKRVAYDFNTVIVVHWIAVSSVCYNPFIYFWLNRRRFEQILRPGLMALCKGTCCGCYSSLICPVMYDASPTDTSPAVELKEIRVCRRCRQGRQESEEKKKGRQESEEKRKGRQDLPDAVTFSDLSDRGRNDTAREMIRTSLSPRILSTNNLNTPFASSSYSTSIQLNQLHVPFNGKNFAVTTTSNNTNSFSSFNIANTFQSIRSQQTQHRRSLSSKCFSCNICQKQSLSDESASMTKQNDQLQNSFTTHGTVSIAQKQLPSKGSNNKRSSSDSSAIKKIWRYRNHHERNKGWGNHTNLGTNNNQTNSVSEIGSSATNSSTSSTGRDWKHHQHHIQCHYGRTWGRPVNDRRQNGMITNDMTLTSL